MNLANRYARNHGCLTEGDQQALGKARAAIVGCGGLGGYIAEELARLGIGSLVLIDGDSIEVSNLNRQILAHEKNLGQYKVEAAQARIALVNSQTQVDVIAQYFTAETGTHFLNEVDLVFDGLDSGAARLSLESVCHDLGKPLVFASIGGWFGLVGCSFPGDLTVRRLFGRAKQGIEKELGNPAFTPAVLASLAVAEGVKIILGQDPSLRYGWLQVDLLAMEFERVRVYEH